MLFKLAQIPYELRSNEQAQVPWSQYRAAFLTAEDAIKAIPPLPLAEARTLALNALWNDPQRNEPLVLHLAARLHGIPTDPLVAAPYKPHERAVLLAFNTRSPGDATLHAKRAWGLLLTQSKPVEPLEFPYDVPDATPPKHLPLPGEPCLTATRDYKKSNAVFHFHCKNTDKTFDKTARITDLNNVICPWCRTKQQVTLAPKPLRAPKYVNQTYGCWSSTGRWYDTYANTKYEVVCMTSGQILTVTAQQFKNNKGHCRFCKDLV